MFVLPRGRYAEMSRCLGLSGSIDWRYCTGYSTCPCKLIRLRYDSSVQRKLSVARLTGAKWEEEAAWRRDSTWNRRGVELSRPMLLSEEGEGHPSLRWLFIIVIKRKATWIICQVYMGELYTVWTCGCDHHYCSGETNILSCFIHPMIQQPRE